MKDWKLRQDLFHKLHSSDEIGDDLKKEIIIEQWDKDQIIAKAIDYLHHDTKELYYPAKSYIIALTYALLLEKEFSEPLLEGLSDEMLLFDNDPYFKPYPQAKEIYDELISLYPREALEKPELYSKNFQRTHEYFYLEFLLHEKTAIYAPS